MYFTLNSPNEVHVIDASSGERHMTQTDGPSCCTARHGMCAVAAVHERSVCIMDTSAHILTTLQHDRAVWSVCFFHHSKRIASGDGEGNLRISDVETQSIIVQVKPHTDAIWSIDVSHDDQLVFTASHDHTACVLRSTGEVLTVLRGHTHSVMAVLAFSDGIRCATASLDCTVRVWNIQTGECVHSQLFSNSILSLAGSECGRMFASGGRDHQVVLWDTQTLQQLWRLPVSDTVDSLAFIPRTNLLLVGVRSTGIEMIDCMNGQIIRRLCSIADGCIYGLAFSEYCAACLVPLHAMHMSHITECTLIDQCANMKTVMQA